jgi:hypothetical protein
MECDRHVAASPHADGVHEAVVGARMSDVLKSKKATSAYLWPEIEAASPTSMRGAPICRW